MTTAATAWAEPYLRLDPAALGPRPCWALARLVYAAEGGPDLPAHTTIDAADLLACADAIEAGRQAGPWRRVMPGAERRLDLVAINRVAGGRLRPAHVGIVTAPGHVLHAERAGIVHQRLDDPSLRRLVDSIWRHRALDSEVGAGERRAA